MEIRIIPLGQEQMSSDPRLIRVLTADDHALLREGIAVLVNGEPDMKLVAEASTGQEAIEHCRFGEIAD